jgi:hypothetical protein
VNSLPLAKKRSADESSDVHATEHLHFRRDGGSPDDYCPEPLAEDAEQRTNSIARTDTHVYSLGRLTDSGRTTTDTSANGNRDTTAGDDTSSNEDAGALVYGRKLANQDRMRSVEPDADEDTAADADAGPDDWPMSEDADRWSIPAALLY